MILEELIVVLFGQVYFKSISIVCFLMKRITTNKT